MRTCNKCGCYCDPGDTVNGTCTDCIEAEQQEEERKDIIRQMLKRNIMEQSDGQLVMVYGK